MRILRPRTLRFRTSRHLRRSKFSQSRCSTSRPKATLQRSLSARFARSFSSGANPSSLGALTCSVGIASPSGAQCSRAASLGLDAPRVQDRCLVLCARSRSEAKTTSMKSALEARAAVVFSGRCCPRRGSCVRTTNGAIPKASAIGRETMAHTKRTSGAARTLLFAWRMLLCQKHRQQRCLSLRRSSRRRLQKQPQTPMLRQPPAPNTNQPIAWSRRTHHALVQHSPSPTMQRRQCRQSLPVTRIPRMRPQRPKDRSTVRNSLSPALSPSSSSSRRARLSSVRWSCH
mmetsp:Transcript_106682/g.300304  ORF Transcript_106682/g.300304 Transcript_106682/m.300304 type:complete len:287 (-) Transcript_106682:802-1662(-)